MSSRIQAFSSGAANSSVPAQSNQASLDRLYADKAHTLNRAVSRMENANQRQGRKIEGRLRSVEDKIDRRLHGLNVRQTRLGNRMDYQALRSQNEDFRGTVNYLTEKCNNMENQTRRNNLVSTGLAPVGGGGGGSESWEDCEMKVKAYIREGMGITERMEIERAHRVGKAIVVKFLSYKHKMLVLTNARKLKTSDGYDNIYVKEEFSETVQKKRQALMTLQRDLRQNGQTAKLRFDNSSPRTRRIPMTSSVTESSVTTGTTDSQPRILIFHDKVTDFGTAVTLGREGVEETFAMDPSVNQGQQQNQNPDPDHH